jgi:cytochrome P450
MGNLAYLLEAGHYDLYSLWHWMLRMLAAHPQAQAGYAARTDRVAREAWARAIVLETLRLEQSELLYWRVAEDIAFEGWLLPRGTVLRICIWEGHKDDATFPEPFRFAPERFIGTRHGLDAFAPFGLGSRRCLGADLVVGLSAMLVRTLLDRWHLERVADGPPLKGPYHWQPGRAFAVRLLRAAQPSR